MSRVITFSRVFPSYHPRAGEPTLFLEKIYASLADTVEGFKIPNDANHLWDWHEYYNCRAPKHHTIRSGHRFKAGDWFTPKVWGDDTNPKSGRKGPYHSKPIRIAPDIQVKKTWDFEIDAAGVCSIAKPGEQQMYTFCYYETLDDIIAKNDGLTHPDFYYWFNLSPDFKKTKEFRGQIICWNESIKY